MKQQRTSFLVFIQVIFLINTGFAQAELRLCQNRCEQSQAVQTETPPCCSLKDANKHATLQDTGHDMSGKDCPHVNSNSKISDSLTFIATSTKIPGPEKSPAFMGIFLADMEQFSHTLSSKYALYSGLSPPDIISPHPIVFSAPF